jgi:DNA-binding ferritin-like protein
MMFNNVIKYQEAVMASSLKLHARLEDQVPVVITSLEKCAPPPVLMACRVSLYGAHTSLVLADRVELVDRLVEHLSVTFDVIEALARVQWRLRTVSFSAIQRTFGDMTGEAVAYGEYVIARIRDCGSKVERSIFQFNVPATTGGPIDFAQCLLTILDRTDKLASLANDLHPVVDRACEEGDLATSKLITELLWRTDRMVRMVQTTVPRDANF